MRKILRVYLVLDPNRFVKNHQKKKRSSGNFISDELDCDTVWLGLGDGIYIKQSRKIKESSRNFNVGELDSDTV